MEQRTLKLLQLFLMSFLGPVIAYIANSVSNLQGAWGLFLAGVLVLLGVSVLTHYTISSLKEPSSWIYYVFAWGMFSSSIDIIIGLENDGRVTGVMTNYLKSGEPYLKTVHGTMICYYDGVCHYAMYAIILYLITRRKSHWEVGLYWASSIGHSMIVFMPGIILGPHSIHPSVLLNVPYCIFPLLSAIHFFNQRDGDKDKQSVQKKSAASLKFFFGIIFASSITVSLFRGFAVLEPERNKFFRAYVSEFEPYLLNENAYPKMQMLTFMFLMTPLYLTCLSWLFGSTLTSTALRWTIVSSGASLQAQVTHIGSSIRMDGDLLTSPHKHVVFWVVNLTLLLAPHLFLLTLVLRKSGIHATSSPKNEKRTEIDHSDTKVIAGSHPFFKKKKKKER